MSFNKYAAAAKSCGCYREAPRRDHGQGNLCGTYDQSYYQGSRCGSFTGGNGARCNFGENVVAAGAALGSAWLLNKFLNNGDAGLVNFYAKQEKLRESECALLCAQCTAYSTGYSNIYFWTLLTAGGTPGITPEETILFGNFPAGLNSVTPPYVTPTQQPLLRAIVSRSGTAVRTNNSQRFDRVSLTNFYSSSGTTSATTLNTIYGSVSTYLIGNQTTALFNVTFLGKPVVDNSGTRPRIRYETLSQAEITANVNWVLAAYANAAAYNEYLSTLRAFNISPAAGSAVLNTCCYRGICAKLVRNAEAVEDLQELEQLIVVSIDLLPEFRRIAQLYFAKLPNGQSLFDAWYKWYITWLGVISPIETDARDLSLRNQFNSAYGGELACAGIPLGSIAELFNTGKVGSPYAAGVDAIVNFFPLIEALASERENTDLVPPVLGRRTFAEALGQVFAALWIKEQLDSALYNIQYAFCSLAVCGTDAYNNMPPLKVQPAGSTSIDCTLAGVPPNA